MEKIYAFYHPSFLFFNEQVLCFLLTSYIKFCSPLILIMALSYEIFLLAHKINSMTNIQVAQHPRYDDPFERIILQIY